MNYRIIFFIISFFMSGADASEADYCSGFMAGYTKKSQILRKDSTPPPCPGFKGTRSPYDDFLAGYSEGERRASDG